MKQEATLNKQDLLVTDEKLRFDYFTHFAPLTKEEIEKVEQEVNKQNLECVRNQNRRNAYR